MEREREGAILREETYNNVLSGCLFIFLIETNKKSKAIEIKLMLFS
jgi:hypothetical protein